MNWCDCVEGSRMDRSASKASVINLDDPVEAGDAYHGLQLDLPPPDPSCLLTAAGIEPEVSSELGSGFGSPQPPASDSHLPSDRGQLIQDVIEQLESQCVLDGLKAPNTSTVLSVDSGTGLEAAELTRVPSSKKAEGGGGKPQQNPEDRRRSAWIPNQKTAHSLHTLPPLDRRLSYTMPGVLTEGKMTDPVMELVKKHLGDMLVPKRISTPDESLAGIYGLIQSGNFRAAIDLSGRLLGSRGQGWGKAHTPSKNTEETLTLWTHRFEIVLGIRYYSLACSEMDTFGDLEAPDLFFQYYPETYHHRRGSMVPFSLRLLHAEMPRFSGNATEALARCNHVISVIKRDLALPPISHTLDHRNMSVFEMLKNMHGGLSEDGRQEIHESDRKLSEDLWNQRLRDAEYCLARTLLSMKEYQLSVSMYNELAESCPDKTEKSRIYSLLGRMQLQLGDFSSATHWFQKFNTTCDHNSCSMKALACLHKGFLSIFYGNYTDAGQAFKAALQYEPKNCDAGNNYGVCLLYEGKLEEAMEVLEELVREHPEVSLREGVCTNLCTLYELATARSGGRKQALLTMVAQTRGDSFTTASLKL